ncbi:uncharacterized protein DEA37_0008002 [Paragonimus westermani]|uniref:Integrase catalytic domain-containing protein n=1 Tax=Paragonimus westermani TaxID=34504 RepID=A0A5J4NWB7_9TREM|nr:uncharacterized protein DEA37_0008002 [Paragonimus westermani]
MLRIHKTRTTPYHPRSNGLVERTNRTVVMILRAFIERHQSDRWDEILPQCLLAYRAAVHSSTGYTPSLLTLGHELRLPIEVLMALAPAECIGLPYYVEELGERLRVAYEIAAQHQSKSQHHKKSCYDRTANGPVYQVTLRPKQLTPITMSNTYSEQITPGFALIMFRSHQLRPYLLTHDASNFQWFPIVRGDDHNDPNLSIVGTYFKEYRMESIIKRWPTTHAVHVY